MKRIQDTRQIKPGTLLRVYRKGFGYAKLQVIDSTDWYLAAHAPKDLVSVIKAGDRLKAYLWVDESVSHEFTTIVNGTMTREHPIVFCSHTRTIKTGTIRKCLTARLHAPFQFFILESHMPHKGFATEKITRLRGIVTELSDWSALFRYDGQLPEDVFIKGRIAAAASPVEIVGKITRAGSARKNVYHIDCSSMGERERAAVLDYVFSVYRE